jgi:hypothetical protein
LLQCLSRFSGYCHSALRQFSGSRSRCRARARLSNEFFSQFLQAIKELNAGRQTRKDTLAQAQDIFGSRNADLYASFEGLLNRHIPAA